MTVINWSSKVNTNFYGYNSKPKENVVLTENLSGRTVGHQSNTKYQMQISCSLRLTKEELSYFWSWFNDDLGQTAGAFYCSALGSSKYRFLSVPEPQDTDQTHRELSLEIEEVY